MSRSPKISESPIATTKISIPSATPFTMLEKFWSKKFAARSQLTGADHRARALRLVPLHTTGYDRPPTATKEEEFVSEEHVSSVDRGEFLKRAGLGVAAASVPFWAADGAWAGIFRKPAQKPIRIGNLLTLSGPN